MNSLIETASDYAVTRRGLLKRALITAGGLTAVATGLIPMDSVAAMASSTSGVWRRLALSVTPSRRAYAAIAYDAERSNVVLFSGLSAPGDTWVFDETGWSALSAVGPASRAGASMAFDPVSRAVLLFGGLTASGPANDTWAWSGSNWTKLNPARQPDARLGAALGYDPISDRLLLFGGVRDVPDANAWRWTGSDWEVASQNSGPSEVRGATLGVDPITKQLRLIGGLSSPMGIPMNSSTWTWDGNRWLSDVSNENTAAFAAYVEFPANDRLAVLGGFEGGSLSDRAWIEAAGSTDVLGANRPGSRAYASMAFEPHANGLLLFGGQDAHGLLDETWLWQPSGGVR